MAAAPTQYADSSPDLAPMTRQVLPAASPHVELALVHVPGLAHAIEPAIFYRIILNVGPSYTVDATTPQGRLALVCKRHSIMVIPPDTPLTHRSTTPKPVGRSVKPVRLAAFRISRELFSGCAMALGLSHREAQLPHQMFQPDEVLRGLALALLADLEAHSPDGALATERTAVALVTRLLLRQKARAPADATPAGAITRVQAHIEAGLQGSLALEELAGVAGMSVFHFCRVFRETLGVTPHQYIVSQRMERAKRLLWSHRHAGAGAQSITDIALACGFASPSHFASQFKRHTGQTPLQWQRAQ